MSVKRKEGINIKLLSQGAHLSSLTEIKREKQIMIIQVVNYKIGLVFWITLKCVLAFRKHPCEELHSKQTES